MDTLQAILLGIVQGITEFLPVSSSGHLQIAKEVLGVQLEENLTFDVALHAATVLSTIVVLWSEVWRLLKGLFSRRFNEEQAYVLKLVLSMIPIGIVGFLLKDRINDLLNAPYILAVVGAMLLVTAALLAFAYYAKPRQKETISYRDALIIGLAQACAAMPGLSRSGSTIATGLLLGNKKAAVAQLDAFRLQEGAILIADLLGRVDKIEGYKQEVVPFEKARTETIKARILDNLEKLQADVDRNRLEQEMIFYLEKLDITEEKVRLANHCRYFREVAAGEEGAGRKLGFIAQEMGREINTMGSKANESNIQILVVKMKDELEKIKEQVLNIL